MSVAIKVSVGRAGAAADHTRYITRERATEGEQERVWTRNVPEYVDRADDQAVGYRERVGDLREYARQTEEDELSRVQPGGGEARTHYRVVYSFDQKVDDSRAREMVNDHLKECFPHARAVAAIHRDTDNTHVHVQIAARDTEGRKLHFSREEFRSIDEKWARVYGREFGQHQEREHLEKKQEWREWMREARAAKEQGREISQRPEREAHRRNQVQERIEMAGRQYGRETGGVSRDADQRAARGNERSTAGREPQAERASGRDARGDGLRAQSRIREPEVARGVGEKRERTPARSTDAPILERGAVRHGTALSDEGRDVAATAGDRGAAGGAEIRGVREVEGQPHDVEGAARRERPGLQLEAQAVRESGPLAAAGAERGAARDREVQGQATRLGGGETDARSRDGAPASFAGLGQGDAARGSVAERLSVVLGRDGGPVLSGADDLARNERRSRLDVAVERATAPLAEQQAKEERSAANVQEQKPEREQTRERGDDRGRDWGMGR